MLAIIKTLLVIVPLLFSTLAVAQSTFDTKTLSRWIQEMKASEKGPFARIRWFCNDGTILAPKPYACVPHGGGRQHGEWNKNTKVLREAGFYVANVLAQINTAELVKTDHDHAILKQILLERFLIEIDDGWIFRGARYYQRIPVDRLITCVHRPWHFHSARRCCCCFMQWCYKCAFRAAPFWCRSTPLHCIMPDHSVRIDQEILLIVSSEGSGGWVSKNR